MAAQNTLVRFEKSIDAGQTAEVEKDLFSYVIANPKGRKRICPSRKNAAQTKSFE